MLYMGGLEFYVVRDGKAGRNIVQQYDAGTQLHLTRPLKDASTRVPGFELAIEMPSLRACLDDVEYHMITTLASENTAEALRTPGGAQWLAQRYSDQAPDAQLMGYVGDCCMGSLVSSLDYWSHLWIIGALSKAYCSLFFCTLIARR